MQCDRRATRPKKLTAAQAQIAKKPLINTTNVGQAITQSADDASFSSVSGDYGVIRQQKRLIKEQKCPTNAKTQIRELRLTNAYSASKQGLGHTESISEPAQPSSKSSSLNT